MQTIDFDKLVAWVTSHKESPYLGSLPPEFTPTMNASMDRYYKNHKGPWEPGNYPTQNIATIVLAISEYQSVILSDPNTAMPIA